MVRQQLSGVATLLHENSVKLARNGQRKLDCQGHFYLTQFLLFCQATTYGHRITGMETQVLENFAHSKLLRMEARNTF